MRSYVVDVQTAPLSVMSIDTLEAVSERLFRDRRLAAATPSANLVTRTLSLRAAVDSPGAAGALEKALGALGDAAEAAGCPRLEWSDITIVRDDGDSEWARDELVGTPDVAGILGVTRERVRQLAEKPGRFPYPVAVIRGTRIWRYGDIADWMAFGRRSAGRPLTVAPAESPKRRAIARARRRAS